MVRFPANRSWGGAPFGVFLGSVPFVASVWVAIVTVISLTSGPTGSSVASVPVRGWLGLHELPIFSILLELLTRLREPLFVSLAIIDMLFRPIAETSSEAPSVAGSTIISASCISTLAVPSSPSSVEILVLAAWSAHFDCCFLGFFGVFHVSFGSFRDFRYCLLVETRHRCRCCFNGG